MGKLNYLNVGCGKKFHVDWVNVDMVSYSPHVVSANLIKGIPFPDNHFDVVYHSQVLEHIPKDNAPNFIKECYRVLKNDGILRVVVPDLENIVDEYKLWLDKCIENHTDLTEANYDWIMLELYDQTVRNQAGGEMAKYLENPSIINQKYVLDRTGFVGYSAREKTELPTSTKDKFQKSFSSITMFLRALKYIKNKLVEKLGLQTYTSKIGMFRLGGEVHMWMYDRYSLARLLKNCGFNEVSKMTPFKSDIPNWCDYELDVKEGMVYDPTSLFMEAKKTILKKS